MSLPKYAEYKDSGTPWLGEVPAHWVIAPVKHLGRLKGGAGFPHVEQGHETEELPFHKVNALGRAGSDGVLWGSENSISRATAERLGAYIFPAHALVFAKVGAALLLGRIRTLGEAACIDNNMMGLVVDDDFADVTFVSYALNLVRFDLIANPGAVPSLNEGQIGDFPLVLPSRTEQSAIAAFLDRETGKIDALIAEQEKLLTLLAEKRRATISNAVTRGLNPKAPMKDSGVPWLREVPLHWKVVSLKKIVATPITDGPHETPVFLDDGVPFVSAEAVSGGVINFSKIRAHISRADHLRFSEKYVPQLFDIYMVKSGATTGVTAIVESDIEFNIWSPLAAIRCDSALAHPYYVLDFFRSRNFQEAVALNWSFGTQQNIGMGVLGNLPIALPPLSEQIEIAKFLKPEAKKFDAQRAPQRPDRCRRHRQDRRP
jgi:type I restriction enzyme, S subunit